MATEEGEQVAKLGSPEFRVYNVVAKAEGGSISKADLMVNKQIYNTKIQNQIVFEYLLQQRFIRHTFCFCFFPLC
jgi:hypothetical protein